MNAPLPPPAPDLTQGVAYALSTLKLEAEALACLHTHMQGQTTVLSLALEKIIASVRRGGHVVVTGMGKSGHIGRKIAATLASTGTPSFYLHPAEAVHGDLGMVGKLDVVLALSHSGESAEIITLLPALKRLGIPLISMCSKANASLSRAADIALILPIDTEACPHNLAPTSSTTAQLALGDALALGVLVAQGFRAEDFARFHPGGSLGKRLLKVADIMHEGHAIPMVQAHASMAFALQEMTRGRLGTTVIVDDPESPHPKIAGLFTDGDLRRMMLMGNVDINRPIREVMQPEPIRIEAQALVAEALALMEAKRINQLLVVDADETLLGIINMHDLLQHRVL